MGKSVINFGIKPTLIKSFFTLFLSFIMRYIGIIILFFCYCIPEILVAQILRVTPPLPTADDTVTVIYDATKGTGGLKDAATIYAHTGVITNKSRNSTDWKYVAAPWGTDNPKIKMTPLGNNLHSLRFHIRSFYGVPADEEIQQLAFVFRNVDGTKEGKDDNGKDIFYTLQTRGSLSVRFLTPGISASYQVGDTIQIHAVTSADATITLFDNTTQLTTANGQELKYNHILMSGSGNTKKFIVHATHNAENATDSVEILIRGQTPVGRFPSGISRDGITYLDDSTVVLMIYALGKKYLYAIGDFNNWELNDAALMTKTPDGERFWIKITGLKPGKEYAFQYVVDNNTRTTDPYAEKILHPTDDARIRSENRYPGLLTYPSGKTTGIVGVFQTAKPKYQWKTTNFKRPDKKDLVIYELLVRDFTERKTFQAVMDSLQYLKKLGINCIELMPVMEYGGNESWGYNPEFLCAVDKFYGTENDLKQLIDSAHSLGMAVVLDMVLNHATGENPLYKLYPSGQNPYFNVVPTHPFNVFNDFNHEFDGTKYFMDRVNLFWLEQFRFDGFRFDLSKGFTQVNSGSNVSAWGRRDTSRIKLLKRMADKIWYVDPTAYIILEHFADNNEETELADYGMMLWGNLNYNYNEATMGWHGSGSQSDFSWIWFQRRGWKYPHAIGYMESHDEERLMVKNLLYGNSAATYSIKDTTTALERIQLAAAFFFTIPGPKMIWQFGELGYDIPIDFNGRIGNKPVRWNYRLDPRRMAIYNTFADLIRLKTSQEVFSTTTCTLSLNGAAKRINLSSPSNTVSIIGNFGVENISISPQFQKTGTWHEFWKRTTLNVTDPSMNITLKPGEFRMYSTVPFPASTVSSSPSLPTQRFVSSVSPNPASISVEISYIVPQRAAVKVQIMDLYGRYHQTLLDTIQEPGHYTALWDISSSETSLLPGVYLYKIQINGGTQIGKILVTR